MVHVKFTTSLLLMKLLAVTAKEDELSVNCGKKGCVFGEPIEVAFKLQNPKVFDEGRRCCNDWIAIYESRDKPGDDDYTMSTYTCGFQAQYPGVRCPNLTSGAVTFDGVDPSEEGRKQQWPLRPGSYKVCHLDYNDNELQKCVKFKVKVDKKIVKKIQKNAFVMPTKEVYDYGEDIVADFDLVVALPNSLISIFRVDSPYEKSWAYTGCNNNEGDQRWSYYVSNDCLKTQTSGKVMFTPDNTYDGYLDGGDYEMRILYANDYAGDYDIIDYPAATFTVNPDPRSSKSPSSKSPSSKSPSSKSPSSKSPSSKSPSCVDPGTKMKDVKGDVDETCSDFSSDKCTDGKHLSQYVGFTSHCPALCDTCATCQDSEMEFNFGGKTKNCAKHATKLSADCNDADYAASCREQCEVCTP